MPLKDVLERHKASTETKDAGPSLNDVQLVQTYVVESTVVLHIETFESIPGQHRDNSYGSRTWVGGMALHLILDKEAPGWDKSQKFAVVPEGEMAELADKRSKMRDKRARKNDNQRLKK